MLFTDRSRYIQRTSNCPRRWYLGYEAYGTGITPGGSYIPLATGGFAHNITEKTLLEVQAHSTIKDQTFRNIIGDVLNDYHTAVGESGFMDVEGYEEVEHIVYEQCALVEGLLWCWYDFVLPGFIDEYEIIAVEQEYEYIMRCTCGLETVGTVEDHHGRSCNGVVLMTRPDIIAASKDNGKYVYTEIKTGAQLDPKDYDNNIQFAFGAVAVERVLDKKVEQSYVHGMIKGSRKGKYDPATKKYSGDKRETSPLCYAYVRPSVPPLIAQDIQPKYNWVGDDGKNHRAGKAYTKTPVWKIDFGSIPMSVSEYYTREIMKEKDAQDLVTVLGPFDYPAFLVKEAIQEIGADEQYYGTVLDTLDSVRDAYGEGSEQMQDALAETIPRSWDCKKWSSTCPYTMICFRREGWDYPLEKYTEGGQHLFNRRSPNHPIEGEYKETFKCLKEEK